MTADLTDDKWSPVVEEDIITPEDEFNAKLYFNGQEQPLHDEYFDITADATPFPPEKETDIPAVYPIPPAVKPPLPRSDDGKKLPDIPLPFPIQGTEGYDPNSETVKDSRKRWDEEVAEEESIFFPYHKQIFLSNDEDPVFLYDRRTKRVITRFQNSYLLVTLTDEARFAFGKEHPEEEVRSATEIIQYERENRGAATAEFVKKRNAESQDYLKDLAKVMMEKVTERQDALEVIASKFASPPAETQDRLCPFARVLQTLPEADRVALTNALIDTRWTAKAIYDTLVSEGHKVSYDSVKLHRRGKCLCSNKGVNSESSGEVGGPAD